MKKVLIAQAKPGQPVGLWQSLTGETRSSALLIDVPVTKMENDTKRKRIKPDVILPYLKRGFSFSENRRALLKNKCDKTPMTAEEKYLYFLTLLTKRILKDDNRTKKAKRRNGERTPNDNTFNIGEATLK